MITNESRPQTVTSQPKYRFLNFDTFSTINRVFAFDCLSGVTDVNGLCTWVGLVDYDDPTKYPVLTGPNDYDSYSDNSEIVRRKGQVLYDRTLGKNEDLYSGECDVQVKINIKTYLINTMGGYLSYINVNNYSIYKYADPNEFGFDPVFYDEYLASLN